MKTLELQFMTEGGKTAQISIENPKEPLDIGAVKQAMNTIIASKVFKTTNGMFVAVNGARIIERKVQEFDLK